MNEKLSLRGKDLSQLALDLEELRAERDKADLEGKDEIERKIGRVERKITKIKAEEAAKAAAPAPLPPLTLNQLLSEAAAVQRGLAEYASKMSGSFAGESLTMGPLQFSPLTQFFAAVWIVFQMRSMSAEKVETYGPWVALLGMSGSAVYDNRSLIFGKPAQSDSGDGTKRERQDNSGAPDASPSASL